MTHQSDEQFRTVNKKSDAILRILSSLELQVDDEEDKS